jgi:excisionase family DNA binding protein
MNTNLISIGKTAKLLGVSIDTVRRWDTSGRLQSVRIGERGHRYYRKDDIMLFLRDDVSIGKEWAEVKQGTEPDETYYCKTRDEFQARLETLQSVLNRSMNTASMSLLTAISGEIGNNSFDHNLGNWPDIMGIFFSYSTRNKIIVLADRGQGILKTLQRVRPGLHSSALALQVAFTETLSGRQPEARGNGLKFVRDVVVSNPFKLYFQSGNAVLQLKQSDTELKIQNSEKSIRGCFATIEYKG